MRIHENSFTCFTKIYRDGLYKSCIPLSVLTSGVTRQVGAFLGYIELWGKRWVNQVPKWSPLPEWWNII